ncbi:hypothetical protein ACHWQZ_G008091 [Mnemiopsis leidyi]
MIQSSTYPRRLDRNVSFSPLHPPPFTHLNLENATVEPSGDPTLRKLAAQVTTSALVPEAPDDIEILPIQIAEMQITRITIIPSAIVLLASCIILCFIIFNYFKRVMELYVGLVFYSMTEVLLFLRILLLYVLADHGSLEYIPCGITKSLSLFTMALPSLAILLITLSRLIFIKYPLRYRSILLVKYQVAACVAAVIFAFLIGMWPALGACHPYYDGNLGLCHLNCDLVCYWYIAAYVTLGIALPTLVVIVVYIYVYNVLKKHRARAKKMRRNSPSNPKQRKYTEYPRESRTPQYEGATSHTPEIVVSDHDKTGITIVNKVCLTINNDTLSINSLSNISIHTQTNLVFTKNDSGLKGESAKASPGADKFRPGTKTADSDLVITNVSVVPSTDLMSSIEKEQQEGNSTVFEEEDTEGKKQVTFWKESPIYEPVCKAAKNLIMSPTLDTTSMKQFDSSTESFDEPDVSRPLKSPNSANSLSPDWFKNQEIIKEDAKLHDIRNIKPMLKKAMKRFSLVTEHTDLLRKKEVPWSLVFLTLLHITTSIPWILILLDQDSSDSPKSGFEKTETFPEEFNLLVNTASARHMYDDKFVKFYRISAEILEKIYHYHSILFCSVTGDNIESAKKLTLTRRYLATGNNFNALANLFKVGHSTVRTIICEVVKFPSTEEDFYKPDIC